jgi:hypothetical protein
MVTPSASAEPELSTAEAVDAIRHLSVADLDRFRRSSYYHSFGGARSPADLRQEAVRRTAAGTRKCPRAVPVVVFLSGVMRSIASADRKALGRASGLAIVRRDDSGLTPELDDPRLSPEDRIIRNERCAELRKSVLALFEDDLVAQTLADGMMSEMEGKELRELVDLDEDGFATKRRFVRRRIDKAFPNGWKP